MDSQFALQAEAMGIDLSGMHESLKEPEVEEESTSNCCLRPVPKTTRTSKTSSTRTLFRRLTKTNFSKMGPMRKREEAGKDEQREA